MKKLLWIGLTLMPLTMKAQSDVAFTNYWALQSYYNPAASGLDGKLNVQAAYAMQMVGFEHAPSTMYVGVDLPLFFVGPRHGVGVGLLNDKVGLFSNKKFYLQYAYHQPLWGGRVSIGARAGMLAESFDGSGVDATDSSDPVFASSQVNGTAVDVDGGIRYTYKQRWYAGFSIMHALAPTVKLGDEKTHQVSYTPTAYLSAGYTHTFRNPAYALQATALLRTDWVAWREDLTARMTYKGEKLNLYGGLTYSPTTSVGVLLGTTFHGINIGYSYEVYTGGIGALHGTHELVVGYTSDLNLFKKGKNKHQSVRIL